MEQPTKRIYRVLIVVVVAVMVAFSWFKPFESVASEQIDAGLKRALITFATARALNATISALQGTEISGSVFVVGGTLSVGQVLDPVNDLVEQFSSLMLVASVAFGVQKALLLIGSNWLVSALFTITAAIWATLYLRGIAPLWLRRVVLVLLVVRFAVPVAVIGSDYVFQTLHAKEYEQSQSFVSATSREVDQLTLDKADSAETEKGLWEKVKDGVTAPLQAVRLRYQNVKEAAEKMADRIISLSVIFLLQTILIPLVILWALRWAAVGLLRRG